MNPPPTTDINPASTLPTVGHRSWFSRIVSRVIFSIMGLFVIAQPFLWLWDSPWGPSVPNMILEAMAIVSCVLLILWAFLWSGWGRQGRMMTAVIILALLSGAIAAIRSVELSGDFGLIVAYRWNPTPAERLAMHRATMVTGPVSASNTVPIATAEDMPAYRGAKRDGVVIGPEVRTTWETPPTPVWKHPVGGGFASMAVVGDLLVTIEQRENQEAIVCYSVETGNELWVHAYPANFSALGGPGPRATPTIDGDAVFSQGAEGELVCLDLITGKVRWSKNLMKLFSVPNSTWGFTSSPLVIQHRVIANAGGVQGDGLVAFDRNTGEVLWRGAGLSTPREAPATATTEPVPTDGEHLAPAPGSTSLTGYCSPVVETIHGVPQIINFDGAALRGHAIETGQTLWSFPFRNRPAVNVAQPIVFDDGRIFLSASYDVGSAMLQISHENDLWLVNPLWDNKQLRCKFTSPILFEEFLYGLDEGILVCLDPQTGQRRWKAGRYRHGQLLLTHGILIVQTEDGRIVFVRPSPEKLNELGEFQALSRDDKCWNPPALVRGRLLTRNHRDMACYDIAVK